MWGGIPRPGFRKKKNVSAYVNHLCPLSRLVGRNTKLHNNSALYLEEVHAQIQAVGAQAGVPGDLETP